VRLLRWQGAGRVRQDFQYNWLAHPSRHDFTLQPLAFLLPQFASSQAERRKGTLRAQGDVLADHPGWHFTMTPAPRLPSAAAEEAPHRKAGLLDEG